LLICEKVDVGERLSDQWNEKPKLQLALLFDESLILIVGTDPNPDEIHPVLDRKRPIMRSGSRRPKFADLFEM
jgi:hypothetical protein